MKGRITLKGFFKVWLAIFGILAGITITICLTILSFFVNLVFGIFIALAALATWITLGFYAIFT